jgi:hypothetical protein
MEIKLLLSKEEILQRVKAKTTRKARADRANAKESADSVRYSHNEEAGGDKDSDFLLLSSLRTALGRFKSIVAEYVIATEGTPTADNIHDNLINTTVDVFTVTMEVSDRFNEAFTQPLADHASSYIECQMLYDWYLPIAPEVAKNMAAAAAGVQVEINQCFIKTRPKVPTYKYPTEIIMRYPIIPDRDGLPGYITPDNEDLMQPEMLFGNPWIMGIGQESEISYTLRSEQDDFAPLDDIVVRADNGRVCGVGLKNGRWHCWGKNTGYTTVTLYSRHNDQVFCQFAVRIVKK